MIDSIDWEKLRARIQETPVVVKPKHIRHPNRSPESLVKRKERSKVRCREYYQEHKDELRVKYKEWVAANPDKVQAKKKRYYERHKDDPAFKAKRAEWKRMWLARAKVEYNGIPSTLSKIA